MLQNKSLNECTLIGKCANNPELRHTRKNVPVTNLVLITQDVWRDRNTNEVSHANKWHKIVVWGKLAEKVVKFAKKGALLYVKGPIIYRERELSDGVKTLITEIKAIKIQKICEPNQGGRIQYDTSNENSDENYDNYEDNYEEEEYATA